MNKINLLFLKKKCKFEQMFLNKTAKMNNLSCYKHAHDFLILKITMITPLV